MNKLKKPIKYFLLSIIGLFIIFIVIGNIISHFIGYRKVDNIIPPSEYKMCYFKKSAIEKMGIKSLYEDIFRDSLYILHYTDSCKIVVLIIDKNSNACFRNNVDSFQEKINPELLVFYTDIPEVDVQLKLKTFQSDFNNTSIHFSNCKEIKSIINTKDCQYYHLKAGAMYMTSDDHSYYDVYLGLNNSTYSDFMAYSMNNKLYILALYSTKGKDISPDALFNIVNFSIK